MNAAGALLLPLLAALPVSAGMVGPEVKAQDAPWACSVDWSHIQRDDQMTTVQTEHGSGFLLEPWVVITARHVIPGFIPSEGMTVFCGGQSRRVRTWRWLNPAGDTAALNFGATPWVTASPNDLAVIFLDSPFDGQSASWPRLPRSTKEADKLARSGACTAWGWAGNTLHSQKVTALEDTRGIPGNPKIGPPAWHSDDKHITQYPGPVEEGDSGGPVVCGDGSDKVFVAVTEGVSPNGKVAIYQRVDPYLPFFCENDPAYCKRETISRVATLDSRRLEAVLTSADDWASRLANP